MEYLFSEVIIQKDMKNVSLGLLLKTVQYWIFYGYFIIMIEIYIPMSLVLSQEERYLLCCIKVVVM